MNLKNAAWEILQDVYERRLLLRILSFYEALEDTARDFEVQRFTKYAYELARSFTDFYENVRVLGGSKNEELARLALVKLTQKTLARTLALLGVTAPKRIYFMGKWVSLFRKSAFPQLLAIGAQTSRNFAYLF